MKNTEITVWAEEKHLPREPKRAAEKEGTYDAGDKFGFHEGEVRILTEEELKKEGVEWYPPVTSLLEDDEDFSTKGGTLTYNRVNYPTAKAEGLVKGN